MTRTILPALALILAGGAATAQGLNVDLLRSVDDIDIIGPDGNQVGEVEDILIDADGAPVAAVIEVGGWLDIGDEDVVISLSELTYQNGAYTTTMTSDMLETLPKWDD
ncbi:PRC-barrel domain-containing protein [Citreicella sp. C3M06]|uniref:PRC-barrel domain-containing protein n=1 Tax=Roseobacteraceae TaxID=2854170 RepID=UPI001C08BEF9|nr:MULTISPECIES: PRC-barrel domain-containing protein [Roseobacteraceae]MBU2961255.1 PRC-barrel domain-containing protein [Citreicella sp. C3M06]MDO6585098.1 PRC-barrel domain-containing protein [Salipiger sp. 1_MG-2023]